MSELLLQRLFGDIRSAMQVDDGLREAYLRTFLSLAYDLDREYTKEVLVPYVVQGCGAIFSAVSKTPGRLNDVAPWQAPLIGEVICIYRKAERAQDRLGPDFNGTDLVNLKQVTLYATDYKITKSLNSLNSWLTSAPVDHVVIQGESESGRVNFDNLYLVREQFPSITKLSTHMSHVSMMSGTLHGLKYYESNVRWDELNVIRSPKMDKDAVFHGAHGQYEPVVDRVTRLLRDYTALQGFTLFWDISDLRQHVPKVMELVAQYGKPLKMMWVIDCRAFNKFDLEDRALLSVPEELRSSIWISNKVMSRATVEALVVAGFNVIKERSSFIKTALNV